MKKLGFSLLRARLNILRLCLVTALKLIHPVMPFITEELYQHISHNRGASIMVQDYPVPNQWSHMESLSEKSASMGIVLGLASHVRSMKAQWIAFEFCGLFLYFDRVPR